jgi:lipopolysaccharide biosynthesis regulator YciM
LAPAGVHEGERRRGDTDAALRRAALHVLDHDLEAAEDLLARAVRADSKAIDAYLALARLYRMRGEIGRAIRIHQNLLLRRDLGEEQRVEALAGLAGDFQQGGFLRRAIASYEELLARRPHHVGALRALARLLADAREFPRALEMQRRLAKREKRAPGAGEATLRVEMAGALQGEGRSDDARRALRKALRQDPRNVRGWIRLGEVEAERGRTAKALEAWRRVPDIDRRSGPLVYPRLEATFAALDRAREYEAFLRGLLESQPRDAAVRLALASTLAARGEIGQAVAEVHAVLERDPERLEAHAMLGRILLGEPGESEALKAYADLLEVLERQGLLRSRERSE